MGAPEKSVQQFNMRRLLRAFLFAPALSALRLALPIYLSVLVLAVIQSDILFDDAAEAMCLVIFSAAIFTIVLLLVSTVLLYTYFLVLGVPLVLIALPFNITNKHLFIVAGALAGALVALIMPPQFKFSSVTGLQIPEILTLVATIFIGAFTGYTFWTVGISPKFTPGTAAESVGKKDLLNPKFNNIQVVKSFLLAPILPLMITIPLMITTITLWITFWAGVVNNSQAPHNIIQELLAGIVLAIMLIFPILFFGIITAYSATILLAAPIFFYLKSHIHISNRICVLAGSLLSIPICLSSIHFDGLVLMGAKLQPIFPIYFLIILAGAATGHRFWRIGIKSVDSK
jgi:hypothetical protein